MKLKCLLRNLRYKRAWRCLFFALPSKQGPLQGRFKLAHDSAELVAGRPISLSAKAPACVRRFETPTPLNHGRPALVLGFRSCAWIGEYFTSLFSLLMPYEPGLGQGQSQKKTSPCSEDGYCMNSPEVKCQCLLPKSVRM
jgi:hypothetical protein